jgi:hypothetical protein
MKTYKNSIRAIDFLSWYFREGAELRNYISEEYDAIPIGGKKEISVQDMMNSCVSIPQRICVDNKGNEDYTPADVELIMDTRYDQDAPRWKEGY